MKKMQDPFRYSKRISGGGKVKLKYCKFFMNIIIGKIRKHPRHSAGVFYIDDRIYK